MAFLAQLWRAGLPARGPWRAAAVLAVLACSVPLAAWLGVRLLPPAWAGWLFFNDSTAQWSFARFAMERPAAELYDGAALHAFQRELFPPLRHTFPFPYPPHYLFAVWPLGWLDPRLVWPAWTGGTLLLFVLAGCAGGRWRDAGLLALAPAAVVAAGYGQNGFLTGALILGGLRLLGRHPAWAGVLLAGATIKPHLGLLIPLALLAAGQWRALAGGAAGVLGLVALSALAFGWEAWPRFLATILGHAGVIDPWVGDLRKATIAANLTLAGLPRAVAYQVQWGLAAGLAVLVALAFRHQARTGGITPWGIALLLAAGFAATPYGFLYDLPVLVAAVLMLARDPAGAARPLAWPEVAVLGAALLFPVAAVMTSRFYWMTGASLLALVALAAFRVFTPTPADRGSGGRRESG
jgi:hypothetical protein